MKSSQILSARHLIFFKTFSLNFDYHLLSSPLPCMRWLNRCTSFLNVHLLIPALYVLFSFCFISALTFFSSLCAVLFFKTAVMSLIFINGCTHLLSDFLNKSSRNGLTHLCLLTEIALKLCLLHIH